MGQMIAITGTSGSGKTTFSTNLACSLAEKEKVVIVMAAELNYGTIQSFFGTPVEKGRGTLESLVDNTEQPEKMLTQCEKISENIYLMAIPNENYEVHVEGLEKEKVEMLLRRLSMLADYLIIDCTNDLYNGITLKAIEKANQVYCLYKSTLNAMLWHRAMIPVLSQIAGGKIYAILSEHQLGCPPNSFIKSAGIDIQGYLPNVSEAPILENIGKPIYLDKSKASQLYKKVISDISENIINGKEEEI